MVPAFSKTQIEHIKKLSPIKPHHLRGQYVLQFAKLLQRDFTDSDVCKVARFRPCTKSCVAPACRLKGGVNGFPHSGCRSRQY